MTDFTIDTPGNECSVEGCTQRHHCKGYCNRHYRRWKKYGDPHYTIPRPTESERFWSKVDKSGECWIWTGGKRNGYGFFNVRPTTIGAHRFAYIEANGPVPEGLVIDHRCRVKLCVNPKHLQAVTIALNGQNVSGPDSNNRSGVRNVWWCKTWKRWTGQVAFMGTKHSIGHHTTKEAAAEAALSLRNELYVNNLKDREKSVA